MKKWYLEINEILNKSSKENDMCFIINNYFNDMLGNNYNLLNFDNPDFIVDCDCPVLITRVVRKLNIYIFDCLSFTI